MKLPEYVRNCVDALEAAGHAAYAVGGCVRDSLLGLTPHDYDLCTDATPEQIRYIFRDHPLVLAGEKHGTVTVIVQEQPVEITTFRTEGGYEDSRHPDWVRFVPTVEEDLSRRDFTVNAMAWSPTRGFADPFGGREDLKNHLLRAVGDPKVRFTEDALRILRGVRFAVRYSLTVDRPTEEAMFSLAPLMDKLAKERIFDELCKLLPLLKAADILRFAPVLCQVIPALAPMAGFDQRNPHHAYDLLTHTAHVVENVPPVLPLRFAALLHDVGKVDTFYLDENGRGHFPGHAAVSAKAADSILLSLKAPTALRQQVVQLIELHMLITEPDKKLLRRRLGKYGVELMRMLLVLQRADLAAKGTGDTTGNFAQTEQLMEQLLAENACLTVKDLAVTGHDLIALGFVPGPGIGSCLDRLLLAVQEERLPNEKTMLLSAAKYLLNSEVSP